MEHFAIIQALCRSALAEPNDAVRRQVERLRDALAESGATKEAATIIATPDDGVSDKLHGAEPAHPIEGPPTETARYLTAQSAAPVDRETAAPLATLTFPDEIPEQPPILTNDVHAAVSGLMDEWRHRVKLERVNVEIARSCLIYGAPGTGKTRLALWMCRQLRLPAVTAKLDGLVSSFLGTTSRNIGALFAFAARYQCVLLLDEFDAIAKVRDDPQEVGEIKRVVNTLLQNLDTRRHVGFTIGITNHETLLDSAVWRRFDAQLRNSGAGLLRGRLEIIRRYLTPLSLEEPELRFLAWITDGVSGADIEALINSIKKSIALDPESTELIPLLQRAFILHSGRFGSDRTAALQLDAAQLTKMLLAVKELGFHQSDVAVLFKRNKATVSRWLRDEAPAATAAAH